MPLQLDPHACRLMKEQVRKTNGQFYNPQNITTKNKFYENGVDLPKSITGKQVKPIPKEKWEKMRYEEQCWIYNYRGTYQKECKPIINTSKDALAGGKSQLELPSNSNNTHNFYEMHNHPLFRENFPNPVDINKSYWDYGDFHIDQTPYLRHCIGSMDHKGKPHILCFKSKDHLIKQIQHYRPIFEKFSEIDEQNITEKEAKQKYPHLMAKLENFKQFTEQLKVITTSKWEKVMDNEQTSLGYVVSLRENNEGIKEIEVYSLPNSEERRKNRELFKQEFSDILKFGEC